MTKTDKILDEWWEELGNFRNIEKLKVVKPEELQDLKDRLNKGPKTGNSKKNQENSKDPL